MAQIKTAHAHAKIHNWSPSFLAYRRDAWAEIKYSKGCPILKNKSTNLPNVSKKRKVAKSHSRFIVIDLPAEIAIKYVNSESAQFFKQMDFRVLAFPNPLRYENNYWAKCCPSVAAVRYMQRNLYDFELVPKFDHQKSGKEKQLNHPPCFQSPGVSPRGLFMDIHPWPRGSQGVAPGRLRGEYVDRHYR
jgi:hypothetical protein